MHSRFSPIPSSYGTLNLREPFNRSRHNCRRNASRVKSIRTCTNRVYARPRASFARASLASIDNYSIRCLYIMNRTSFSVSASCDPLVSFATNERNVRRRLTRAQTHMLPTCKQGLHFVDDDDVGCVLLALRAGRVFVLEARAMRNVCWWWWYDETACDSIMKGRKDSRSFAANYSCCLFGYAMEWDCQTDRNEAWAVSETISTGHVFR